MNLKLLEKKKYILFLQIGLFALVYIAIFIFFRSKLADLSKIIIMAERIYGAYGYYLIFLGALVEGIFILGFYVPGSLIVFLGVSLSRLGILSFPLVVLFGTLGFCLAYCINYCLGRFGWYKIIESIGIEKQIFDAEKKLKAHYSPALFWGYIMPSTGAMLSTASGILKIPFKEFILKTVIIESFWSLILGGLAYTFGMTFINIFLIYFGTITLLSFVLYMLRKVYKKKEEH